MKTLKSEIKNIKGIGLMSGVEAVVDLYPSDEKGIRFYVNNNPPIEANVHNVVSTEHCVVLAKPSKSGAHIMLVEHFMAAAAIVGVEALDVHVNSPAQEFPIMDGSAKFWVDIFKKDGLMGKAEMIAPLKEEIVYKNDRSSVALYPSKGFTTIEYTVNYNHPDYKNRTFKLVDNFDEIIEARTFGYLKDLETFQKMGFSKGVTIENTVGLTEEGGYTTKLRSDFEPVKHKILDIIGDLFLTGVNPFALNADIVVCEAGHALHIEAAKDLEKKYNKEIN